MPFKNLIISEPRYTQTHTEKNSYVYKGFSTINNAIKLYDFDLIKRDILNHFNTKKGSRVMNPDFGTIIWDLMFEPLSEENKDLLSQDIKTICNYDPRAYASKINIVEYERGFLIEITLNLKNSNQVELMKLMFDQKLGLQIT